MSAFDGGFYAPPDSGIAMRFSCALDVLMLPVQRVTDEDPTLVAAVRRTAYTRGLLEGEWLDKLVLASIGLLLRYHLVKVTVSETFPHRDLLREGEWAPRWRSRLGDMSH